MAWHHWVKGPKGREWVLEELDGWLAQLSELQAANGELAEKLAKLEGGPVTEPTCAGCTELREENARLPAENDKLRTERVEYHEPWWPGAEGVLAGSGYDG